MCKSICSVEGCELPVKARGWCNAHYKQQSKGRAFTPVRVGVRGGSSAHVRFWSRVDKSDIEGCWTWKGSLGTHGYGRIMVGQRYVGAHRFSYELLNGTIPKGLVIDHMCHNPSCVRPSHLQAVTHKQNTENREGAAAHSKTGVRGVHWSEPKQRYIGQVKHEGKKHFAGAFKTLPEAEQAVIAKRNTLFSNNLRDR